MTDPVPSEEQISVGFLTDLCRTGDINFRFSHRSSAAEGIAGHQRVQRSRGNGYERELAVQGTVISGGRKMTVAGRIDGVYEEDGLTALDEIKTVRVELSDIPVGVMDGFWLQAQIYGYLLAVDRNLQSLKLRLCFYHLDSRTETVLERLHSLEELARSFSRAVGIYTQIREDREIWQMRRDASMQNLAFPYADYRAGQRDMAVSVYRAIQHREQLVLQAPTGIGKTMATIYPAVRALTGGDLQRVFYLSARSMTQALAAHAVQDLAAKGARLRSVTLTAKDKVCLSPGEPCHPDHCPYAVGYFDKVPDVIREMLDEADHFDRELIATTAMEKAVCPFELSLDLARHCDIVISDYNYVFDPVVYLRRFFETGRRDSVVLVDESHNLVDRGRDMFSASVSKQLFMTLSKAGLVRVSKAAARVNRSILALRKPVLDAINQSGAASFTEKPGDLVTSLQAFCEAAEQVLREEDRGSGHEDLLACYFAALRFVRTAEAFEEDYATVLRKNGKSIDVRLSCVSPARQLSAVYERLASVICFSATLTPRDYFVKLLGFDSMAPWYRLASPFPPENLQVSIASHIDTSYRGRQASLPELVSLIHDAVNTKTGNYLVFFPSYDYMEKAADLYLQRYPEQTVLLQERSLSDDARQAFVAAFDNTPCCGFAVMGGIFSEGIDLKGERLIGAIVVGVGLPQIDIERDLIRDYFDEGLDERGFAFAYQYPGLVRVMQTAGRVIRDDGDRGVICLVDRRYQERRYRELLPDYWTISTANSTKEVIACLESFWLSKVP